MEYRMTVDPTTHRDIQDAAPTEPAPLDAPAQPPIPATPWFARYVQRCVRVKTGVKAGEGTGGKWPIGG
ncbi:hypothetical protein [Nannocystis pusilla]|uniref:hypothetical protein n=1 Tax=Nannocystis pusilla TaxID=889268 RepID=UPI003DA6C225